MILYNMRYRGPYEYEKFILNIYQFHNEMLRIKGELSKDNEENMKVFTARVNELEKKISEANDKLLHLRERSTEI